MAIEQLISNIGITPDGTKITYLPPDRKKEEADKLFSENMWNRQERQADQQEVALRHPLSGNGRAISFGGRVLPKRPKF